MRPLLLTVVLLLLVSATLRAQTMVTRVIDGDTYELSDGRTVRLIGIDTPEKHPSGKLRRDATRSGRDARAIQVLGRAASRHAEQLVRGKRVELEFDPSNTSSGHRDRYGRTLAYVWVIENGRRVFQVNRRLVADGYAYAYTSYPFRYADEFRRLQAEARMRKRGLWGEGLIAPATGRRSSANTSRSDGQDRDCGHFRTQREAQAFFEAAGPGDPHRLDRDGDGRVCESLPG